MRLLLDTHALLWWLAGDERLSLRARCAIGDRMLVAQAREERLALVSNEAVFDEYGISRYW